MENTTEGKKELKVVFEGTKTNGDLIKALVIYFTNSLCGDFILSQALEQVKENNKKIEEFKKKLIK